MTVATIPEAQMPEAPAGALRASATWRERAASAAVVAVVVHFRAADETAACVASLRAHAPAVSIVVVDNDGQPEPCAALRLLAAESADCALFVTGSNGGFGAGCNAGFAVALANAGAVRHVLLINPDARATAGMVDRLCAAAAAHPDAGIVGGTILAADGRTVQFANGRHRPWTLSRLHCAAPSREAAFATTFVTGALMLVDAGMLRAGLRFDERFFLYVEDLDLCCEVRDRGRTLWIEPRAIALHRGGACAATAPAVLGTATADQVYWLARSKVLFAGKRANAWQRRWLLLLAAVVKPIAGLLIAPNGRFLTAHWRGLRDGLRTLRAERRGATPPSAATPPAPSRA